MARRGQGGFTLIELLVVIAILAILAGAAIVGIGAMRENAKRNACKSDMDTIQTAAEAWDLDETKNPGGVAGALQGAAKTKLDGSGYLKKVSSSNFNLAYDATTGYTATPITTAGSKYDGVTGC